MFVISSVLNKFVPSNVNPLGLEEGEAKLSTINPTLSPNTYILSSPKSAAIIPITYDCEEELLLLLLELEDDDVDTEMLEFEDEEDDDELLEEQELEDDELVDTEDVLTDAWLLDDVLETDVLDELNDR